MECRLSFGWAGQASPGPWRSGAPERTQNRGSVEFLQASAAPEEPLLKAIAQTLHRQILGSLIESSELRMIRRQRDNFEPAQMSMVSWAFSSFGDSWACRNEWGKLVCACL